MSVKSSSTGTKVLAVLDGVAEHQPIGVSELARLMQLDKSTTQRMLITLEQGGWISEDGEGRATRWRLTEKIRLMAERAFSGSNLKLRARPHLETIRDQTGETALLNVRDGNRFRVVDIAESEQILRVVPRVGQEVVGPVSATALACTPHLSPGARAQLLGDKLPVGVKKEIAAVGRVGYAIWENPLAGGTVSIAAAIRDGSAGPIATIVFTAPAHRVSTKSRKAAGLLVRDAADALSDA